MIKLSLAIKSPLIVNPISKLRTYSLALVWNQCVTVLFFVFKEQSEHFLPIVVAMFSIISLLVCWLCLKLIRGVIFWKLVIVVIGSRNFIKILLFGLAVAAGETMSLFTCAIGAKSLFGSER